MEANTTSTWKVRRPSVGSKRAPGWEWQAEGRQVRRASARALREGKPDASLSSVGGLASFNTFVQEEGVGRALYQRFGHLKVGKWVHVFDVDVERGTILIREGKRSNDRVVPIGERALAWIEKYHREVRQQLLTDPNNTVLFVSRLGDGLTPEHLTMIVRAHVKAANIGKTGSCHLFRHAMATLMLEGGADVRMVQAMLGHASLNTTALYTHVAIRALREVHERTHPGAWLGKPEVTKSKDRSAEVEATELLAALEAEGAEEVERSGAVSSFDEEPATE